MYFFTLRKLRNSLFSRPRAGSQSPTEDKTPSPDEKVLRLAEPASRVKQTSQICHTLLAKDADHKSIRSDR